MYPIKLVEQFALIMANEPVRVFHDYDDEWSSCTALQHCMIGYSYTEFYFADHNFLHACEVINSEATQFMGLSLIIAHEIGHWKTRNNFTEKELHHYWQEVEEATEESYPFIKIEAAATKWGIDWLLSHKEIVQEFERKIHLYSDN